MIKFYDPSGVSHFGQATITRTTSVNGGLSLTGEVFAGDDVLTGLDYGWWLNFDNEKYVITYKKLSDDTNTIVFDAVQKFFWDFAKVALHSEYTGSHEYTFYLNQLFNGSGYTYNNDATVPAFEKENWGYKNKLSLFNDVMDQADVEFEVHNERVHIAKQIGSDLTSFVRKGINLSNLTEEMKISDFATYAKGYGAFKDSDDQSKGRLEVEYRSELADRFGDLEMDPIVDERYTVADNLIAELKKQVDATYTVSMTMNIYDLENAGYPNYESPKVGDWILAIDEALNFKRKVRIIKLEEQFDATGKRIGYTATCGDLNIVDQYTNIQSSLDSKVQSIQRSVDNVAASANGKNSNYYGAKEPVSANEGDLWFDQSNSDPDKWSIKQWANGRWEQLTLNPGEVDAKVSVAKHAADTAVENANNAVDNANKAVKGAGFANQTASAAKQSAADAVTVSNQANLISSQAQASALTASSDALTALTNSKTAVTNAKTALDNSTATDKSVTSLVTKVDDIAGTITTLATQKTVDSISKTVSDNTLKLAATATSAQLAVTQTQVNTISGTVKNQGVSIDVLTQGLKLKASQDAVNTVTGDVSKLKNTVDLQANQLLAKLERTDVTSMLSSYATQNYTNTQINASAGLLSASISKVESAMSNFSQAGVNLVPNSALQTNKDDWIGPGTPTGNYTVITQTEASVSGQRRFFYKSINGIEPSTSYCIAAEVYVEESNGKTIDTDIHLRCGRSGNDYTDLASQIDTSLIGVWQRPTIVWKTPDKFAIATFYLAMSANFIGKIRIRFVLVAKSEVCIPWSASPLDSTNYTDTKVANLKLTVDGLTQTTTKTTADLVSANDAIKTAQSAADNANKGVTTVTNQLKTTSDGLSNLTSKVTGNSTQITSLQSGISGVSSTVTSVKSQLDNLQVGARNLLIDTAFNGGSAKWNLRSNAGNAKFLTDDVPLGVGQNKTLKWTESTFDVGGGISQGTYGRVVAGKKYMFSVWAKADKEGVVLVAESNSSWSPKLKLTTEWQKYSGFMSFQNDNRDFHLRYDGSGINGVPVYINSPQLELGTIATPWRPAPEDQATVDWTKSQLDIKDGKISAAVTSLKNDITNATAGMATQTWTQGKLDLTADNLTSQISSVQNGLDTKYTKLEQTLKGVQITANNAVTQGQLTLLSDQFTSTITDTNSSLSSQITQLKDDINLSVKTGDLISQINVESGETLIESASGKGVLNLSAATVNFSGEAFIPAASIKDLSADYINAGTLDASKVNLISVNAASITAGIITGDNLSINLDSGEVLFQKGSIKSVATLSGGQLDIEIDDGTFTQSDSSGRGMRFQNGNIYLVTDVAEPFVEGSSRIADYGSLQYSSVIMFGKSGVTLTGNQATTVATQSFMNTPLWTFGSNMLDAGRITGSAVALDDTNAAIISSKQISLKSGFAYQASTTKVSPWLGVGTKNKYRAGGMDWEHDDDFGPDIYMEASSVVFSATPGHTHITFALASDSRSGYALSMGIKNRTYSGAANMIITDNGVLGRVTSARKYKLLDHDAETVIDHAKRILDINPKQWFDKAEVETISKSLTDSTENQLMSDYKFQQYYGFIADDFHDAGLDEVVQFKNGEVDSLAYDRIPMYHNVILKDHETRIEKLERENKELKQQLAAIS